MKRIYTITLLVLASLALIFTAESVNADSITVRSSVRMPANGSPLILRQVAQLTGESALACGDIVVQETDLSSLSNNMIVVKILDAAKKSAETGATIELTH